MTRAWRCYGTTSICISGLPRKPNVWATLTERDSRIYEDNDLEVFIAGQNTYYEFEINALNTIYEVFWVWKDAALPPGFDPAHRRIMTLSGVGGHQHPRGERWGFLDWDFRGCGMPCT